MTTNDYKAKQELARKIEQYANTDKRMNNSFYSIAFEELGRFIYELSKLDCFAAKVAQSVDATMDKGGKVARVSSKQAWILACAGIENNITF